MARDGAASILKYEVEACCMNDFVAALTERKSAIAGHHRTNVLAAHALYVKGAQIVGGDLRSSRILYYPKLGCDFD